MPVWLRGESSAPFKYSRSFAPSETRAMWVHLCSGNASLEVNRSHKLSMLFTPKATFVLITEERLRCTKKRESSCVRDDDTTINYTIQLELR
jgi:hypothetical protein